jgi:serine/threonine protein phosphatase PrpC
MTGLRPTNEDTEICDSIRINNIDFVILAVFDGHGGFEASEYCMKNFISYFTDEYASNNKDVD